MQSTEPKLVELPKITDLRGNLSFIQSPQSVPFDIARCYW
ncbi:MAG: FdtA/QdtA family cupin domain-containing protein, partial [Muribaculaceae bacterium]|nr:FdtA/QdtA family cupin domain-containing protein [Muribaculaceae bacterium]